MDFNRKALGLALGAVAAVAVSLTAAPASAMDISGAYYAADGGHAKPSRAERRAKKRADRDGHTDRDGNYSRDVERSRGDNSVGRTTTITNDDTGNSATRERTTSRDPETGAITHSNEVTGPNGEQTWSSSTTGVKTDDGRTATTTVTGTDGVTRSRTVDVSKDPASQTATKTVTRTGADGTTSERDSTLTKTEDGYARTTEFDGGGKTEVNATYNEQTGQWERDVTRARGDDSATTGDVVDGDSAMDTSQTDQVSEPTKN